MSSNDFTYGDNYVFVDIALTFDEGEEFCIRNFGTHLASIHNIIDNMEGYNLCGHRYCWIGWTDRENAGTWIWTDGSPSDYDSWGVTVSGQPEPGGGLDANCAHYWGYITQTHYGRWGDENCENNQLPFLCNYVHKELPVTIFNPLVDSLPIASFNASSSACYPQNARLSSNDGWCANTINSDEYLQIEFIEPKQIISTIIYARPNGGDSQWVKTYYFQYSINGVDFIDAYNDNNNNTFNGNDDNITGVFSLLNQTVIAKSVRIIPIEYNNWKSLRIEIFGHEHPCQYIYDGNWLLVRHAYNQYHPATDDLIGTEIYGTFDNNPQSLNTWSIQFDNILELDGSTVFMFSNGDCSEWLITTNDIIRSWS